MKPSDFIGEKAVYDETGQYIWAVDSEGGHQKLADLRGWGAIQHLFIDKKGDIDKEKAAAFQDELGQWLVDAINEKLNREKNLSEVSKNDLIEEYLNPVGISVKDLYDNNSLSQIHQLMEAYHLEKLKNK